MSPLDPARAMPMPRQGDFAAWLAEHGAIEKEAVDCIYKAVSGQQTIRFVDLPETALC